MGIIIAIGLFVVAAVLFLATKTGFIGNETLQILANVAAVVALIAAAVLFIVPPPTSSEPEALKSDIPIFDNFEGEFNNSKWYVDAKNPDKSTYSVKQDEGRLCFSIRNPGDNDLEIALRNQITDPVKEVEADLTLVSGSGNFGIDTWDTNGWDNYVLDSRKLLWAEYGPHGGYEEKIFQNINCCPATHRLKVSYDSNQVEYFIDGVKVHSRSRKEQPDNYGVTITAFPRSEIDACVDELRVRFN